MRTRLDSDSYQKLLAAVAIEEKNGRQETDLFELMALNAGTFIALGRRVIMCIMIVPISI
jgi:hypothetical protein